MTPHIPAEPVADGRDVAMEAIAKALKPAAESAAAPLDAWEGTVSIDHQRYPVTPDLMKKYKFDIRYGESYAFGTMHAEGRKYLVVLRRREAR